MAGVGYIEGALDGLHDYLVANLETHLRAIEVTRGLAVGFLDDPEEYRRASVPIRAVSPMVQSFYLSDSAADQRNGRFWVKMRTVISFVGTTDHEENELKMNRYADALALALRAGNTLGGTVIQSLLGEGTADAESEDTPAARHVIARDVTVEIEDL